ncbi:MAG: alpha/beta hydrolase domain-containing protein [Pseudomonadota bacterium]
MGREKLFIGMLLLIGSQLLWGAEPDPVMVPTPRARVLATSATSRPFLAALRSQQPVDLLARGYAESEFTVRGFASDSQPYVTRVLVRRPQVGGKFSGRLIVELLDSSSQYETAPLWGFSWDYFLRRGDAWVGVTVSPAQLAALRKYNATRYDTLSLAAVPAEVCGRSQEGFAADVLSQVAALLRSSSKENPLLDLNPQRLILAGYSGSGDHVTAFAAAQHRSLRLGNDTPIFDGYLDVSGMATYLTNPCVNSAIPRGVPFVAVLSESNTVRDMAGAGDAQSEGFRVYEIAGVEGAGLVAAGAPAAADLANAGFVAGVRCREPVMDLMMSHALNAVWQQLDDLLVRAQPLLGLPRIESAIDGGTSGGWRLPQVDLPLAGHLPGRLVSTQSEGNANARPVCDATTGSMPRFDAATLKQLYRSRAEYLRRFNTALEQAVTNRLLLKEDADALKAAVLRTTPAF